MIPPLLARNVQGNWPALAAGWLAGLPGLVDEIAAEWGLTIARPHAMTYHWVASVVRADGTDAVLKLGVPDGHLAPEVEALRIFDGDAAARLLADDPKRGAMLLESVDPGTPLAAIVATDDEAATAVLLEIGERLHRVPPAGCSLPHLRTLAGGFRRYPQDGPIPPATVRRAAAVFDELCASAPADVVLHGDLHHDNVLLGGREPWLAIDPHGFVGDPGYDIGALLYNPDPDDLDPALTRLIPARVEQLSAALPAERVIAWGYVMGVLSSVWDVEADGQATSRAMQVVSLLEPRLS